jgi:tRNA(fMet)-specific endonuclease VapC
MILDTDVLIALGSPRCPGSIKRGLERVAEPLHTTAVNWAELLFGLIRPSLDGKQRLLDDYGAAVIRQLPILPFDQACAEVLAELRAGLESRGQRLDTSDLMIASIALRHDLTLVTGNTRHFSRVPGLRLENWLTEDE